MEFYSPHGEWELTGSTDELEDFKICCPDETVQQNVIKLQVSLSNKSNELN